MNGATSGGLQAPSGEALVLFVDDTPPPPDLGLRVAGAPNRVRVVVVRSVDEAFARLAERPWDVLVVDVTRTTSRPSLLAAARDHDPGLVRIGLCRPSDRAAALAATPLVHQMLVKPWDPDDLATAVSRALAVRSLVTDPTLMRVVGGLDSLPARPRVFSDLQGELARAEPSMATVGRIVASDAAVTAKVLQLVNSSYFGLGRRVSDVTRAITYLGLGILQSLVLSAEAFRAFGRVPAELSLEAMEQHALSSAAAVRAMAKPGSLEDHAVTAALLADVGQLLLADRNPAVYRSVRRDAALRGLPLHVAEEDAFGFSHAEAGARLLALWALPAPVVGAVAAHHRPPTGVPPATPGPDELVYLARLRADPDPADAEPARPDEAWLALAGLAAEAAAGPAQGDVSGTSGDGARPDPPGPPR